MTSDETARKGRLMSDETERDIFESSMSDETVATPEPEPVEEPTPAEPEAVEAAEEQPEQVEAESNRDPETGRFKAKANDQLEGKDQPADEPAEPAAAELEPEPEPQPQQAHNVPLRELLDEREKRQNAEREMAELRRQVAASRQPAQPAEVPDAMENPEGYVQHHMQSVQRQVADRFEAFSRFQAVQQHGEELVNTAYSELEKAVASNPALTHEAARMMQSAHPYGELVSWYQSRKALAEIGSDPNAYKQKLREEFLADPEFQKQVLERARSQAQQPAPSPAQPGKPVVNLPPSLAKTTAAAPSRPETVSDPGDAAIFNEAMT